MSTKIKKVQNCEAELSDFNDVKKIKIDNI